MNIRAHRAEYLNQNRRDWDRQINHGELGERGEADLYCLSPCSPCSPWLICTNVCCSDLDVEGLRGLYCHECEASPSLLAGFWRK